MKNIERIPSIDERNGTFSIGIQIDKFNDFVLEGNKVSIRMMKKLGCVQEGVRRQVTYTNGKYLDWILFGLTKDEFMETQKEN